MVILNIKYPHCCAECELFDGEDLCHGDGTYAVKDKNVKPSWCPIKADVEETKQKIMATRMYNKNKPSEGIFGAEWDEIHQYHDFALDKVLEILNIFEGEKK